MGADRAVLVSDDAAAGSDLVATSRVLAAALEREDADLVAVRPAGDRRRRRRPLGGRRRSAPPAVRLAGDGARGRRRHRPRHAADRVRRRRDRGAAARGGRGERRDQRAALHVAQGDHGRQEEAAGGPARSPISASTPARRARPARGPRCSRSATPPAAAGARKIEDDGDAAEAIVDFLAEKRARMKRPRLPRAPRRRAAEGLARRARQGRHARRGEVAAVLVGGEGREALAAEAGQLRRGDGLRRRGRGARRRRCPSRASTCSSRSSRSERLRHRAVLQLGARRRRRGRARGPARRRAQLGPGRRPSSATATSSASGWPCRTRCWSRWAGARRRGIALFRAGSFDAGADGRRRARGRRSVAVELQAHSRRPRIVGQARRASERARRSRTPR